MSRYDLSAVPAQAGGRKFITFTTKDGLGGNIVPAMAQDREGNLWFGTNDGGVSRYDGKEFLTFTAEDGLTKTGVWAAIQDQEGNLWFGTWGGGASRYGGEQLRTFTTADGLLSDNVVSILEDQQGYLWFGMMDADLRSIRGMSRYDGKEFLSFGPEEGLSAYRLAPTDLLEARAGNLWFGPVRYDGRHFRVFTTADGLVAFAGPQIEDRQGTIWIGGPTGISQYQGDHFVPFTQIDSLGVVSALLEDRKGNIWLATSFRGLLCFDGEQVKAFAPAVLCCTKNANSLGPNKL